MPLPDWAPTNVTYAGSVAETMAFAMVFDEFVTVQVMPYVVLCPGTGGMGPVFVNGPLKCVAVAASVILDESSTCAVAAEETFSGTPVCPCRVPETVKFKSMVGLE
jgi:hypothetical protein